MLDKLKSSDFSQYLNQTFHIDLEPMGNVALDLIEVKDLGSGAESDGDESEENTGSDTNCLSHVPSP